MEVSHLCKDPAAGLSFSTVFLLNQSSYSLRYGSNSSKVSSLIYLTFYFEKDFKLSKNF